MYIPIWYKRRLTNLLWYWLSPTKLNSFELAARALSYLPIKNVKNKRLRIDLSILNGMFGRGELYRVLWIDSSNQLVDCLSKREKWQKKCEMQSVEINTSFDNSRDDITVVFEGILRQLWAVMHCLMLVSMVIQITCMENKTQFKTHLGKQLSHCFTEECVI